MVLRIIFFLAMQILFGSRGLDAKPFLLEDTRKSFHCDSTAIESERKISFELSNLKTEENLDFKMKGEIGQECSAESSDCKRFDDYDSIYKLERVSVEEEKNQGDIVFKGHDNSTLLGEKDANIHNKYFKLYVSILGNFDSHEVFCFEQETEEF